MKVVVLGLDALEYDLVKKWDMKLFKQREYGKVKVPISDRFNIPSSPQVWSSFIKGETIKETIYFKEFKNPLLNFLDKKINFKPIRKMGKKLLGGRDRPVKTNNTIFEEIKNSKPISMPCYNENIELNDKMRIAYKDFDKDDNEFYEIQEKGLKTRRKKLMKALAEEYDLIVVHFYYLDLIQHQLRDDYKEIRKHYKKVSKIVEEVKQKINEKDLLIILSDHGQKNGVHTNHGFYSLSKKLDLGTPKISDFYNIIKTYLKDGLETRIPRKNNKIEEREETNPTKEEIKQRLSELGYF